MQKKQDNVGAIAESETVSLWTTWRFVWPPNMILPQTSTYKTVSLDDVEGVITCSLLFPNVYTLKKARNANSPLIRNEYFSPLLLCPLLVILTEQKETSPMVK